MLIRQPEWLEFGKAGKRVCRNGQWKHVQRGDASVVQMRDCDGLVEGMAREIRKIDGAENALVRRHDGAPQPPVLGFGWEPRSSCLGHALDAGGGSS